MREKIGSFTGKYAFLSNFWGCDIQMRNDVYRSVEHAYQACKTIDPKERAMIRAAGKPGLAKRLGRTHVTLRSDWEQVKEEAMFALLRKKFQIDWLRGLLLDTGTAELVEGNDWHDEYWGVCNGGCRQGPHLPRGKNRLGILLMRVRKEIVGR